MAFAPSVHMPSAWIHKRLETGPGVKRFGVFVSVSRSLNKSFGATTATAAYRATCAIVSSPPTDLLRQYSHQRRHICYIHQGVRRRVFGHYCGSLSHRIPVNVGCFWKRKGRKRLCFCLACERGPWKEKKGSRWLKRKGRNKHFSFERSFVEQEFHVGFDKRRGLSSEGQSQPSCFWHSGPGKATRLKFPRLPFNRCFFIPTVMKQLLC